MRGRKHTNVRGTMRTIAIALVAAGLLLGASGCGKSEKEKESEAAAQSGRGTITCEGAGTSTETGLPSDFPKPDAVTYVKVTKSGPTNEIDGYSTESLEGMYNEYKELFKDAGYEIPFDELEQDHGDSEVS